jgi:hypothetical protein
MALALTWELVILEFTHRIVVCFFEVRCRCKDTRIKEILWMRYITNAFMRIWCNKGWIDWNFEFESPVFYWIRHIAWRRVVRRPVRVSWVFGFSTVTKWYRLQTTKTIWIPWLEVGSLLAPGCSCLQDRFWASRGHWLVAWSKTSVLPSSSHFVSLSSTLNTIGLYMISPPSLLLWKFVSSSEPSLR